MLMHYGYGENTYDEDSSDLHWSKYDCPMAKYISDRIVANGDYGDDEWTNGLGDGWIRYGRRIYSWNDQGFVSCDTYATVDDAAEVTAQAWREISALQDDACRESGCEPCHYCGSLDCGACRAGMADRVDSGSSHKIGCDRDWIG